MKKYFIALLFIFGVTLTFAQSQYKYKSKYKYKYKEENVGLKNLIKQTKKRAEEEREKLIKQNEKRAKEDRERLIKQIKQEEKKKYKEEKEQGDKIKPLYDTEILRKVSVLDIEGIRYENVEVTIKSISAELWCEDDRVRVTVRDKEGKVIWKKSFNQSYMYVLENGQVHVGKPNFDQLVIYRMAYSKGYTGIIREKEGVYD